MTPQTKTASGGDRTALHASTQSWAQTLQIERAASLKTAWRVALAACVVAVLEAIALVVLMPLKTVEPYTLLVDRRSGYVEAARGLKLGPLSEDEAVTQAFLAQYVLARETFDAADINDGYQKVAAWSAGRARASWLRAYDRANPSSVLNTRAASTVISARINSIAMLNATTALVRFETQRLDAADLEPRPDGAWTAVVSFRRSGAPMKMSDRLINPLGFQVTDYRRDVDGGIAR